MGDCSLSFWNPFTSWRLSIFRTGSHVSVYVYCKFFLSSFHFFFSRMDSCLYTSVWCLFYFSTAWYCWLMTWIIFWRTATKPVISYPVFMQSTLTEDICELWTLLYGPPAGKSCVVMYRIPMPKSLLELYMNCGIFLTSPYQYWIEF